MVHGDIKNGIHSAGGSYSQGSRLHGFYESVCCQGRWSGGEEGGEMAEVKTKRNCVQLSAAPTLMMWGPSA